MRQRSRVDTDGCDVLARSPTTTCEQRLSRLHWVLLASLVVCPAPPPLVIFNIALCRAHSLVQCERIARFQHSEACGWSCAVIHFLHSHPLAPNIHTHRRVDKIHTASGMLARPARLRWHCRDQPRPRFCSTSHAQSQNGRSLVSPPYLSSVIFLAQRNDI